MIELLTVYQHKMAAANKVESYVMDHKVVLTGKDNKRKLGNRFQGYMLNKNLYLYLYI